MSKPGVLFDGRTLHSPGIDPYQHAHLSITFNGDIMPREAKYVTFDTEGHIVGLYPINNRRKGRLYQYYEYDVGAGLWIETNDSIYVTTSAIYDKSLNPNIIDIEIIPSSRRLYSIKDFLMHTKLSTDEINELLKRINSGCIIHDGKLYASRGKTQNIIIDGVLYEQI